MSRINIQSIPPHAKKVFAGVLFDVYQWQQELYDGSQATFEKICRPDTAGVLALTPDNKIIVSRQEQPSLKPFWSLLGGIVDNGEEPIHAAQRELLEEAGMQGTLQEWFHVKLSQKIDWTIYTYIAHDCVKVADQLLDAGEKIELHEYSFEEFIELTQEPDFRDTEVSTRVLKALANPQEMSELRRQLLRE